MEQHRIRANGLNFNVWRAGSGGRPLLLLHGWPEFAAVWHKVMDRLADRFTLIAPALSDGPGSGLSLSPKPRKSGANARTSSVGHANSSPPCTICPRSAPTSTGRPTPRRASW